MILWLVAFLDERKILCRVECLQLGVIIDYEVRSWAPTISSLYIYTWFFENRVNESFIFFEVVLILRLRTLYRSYALKKSFFSCRQCFFTFCSNLQREKERQKKKTNAKERKRLKKLDGFWSKKNFDFCACLRFSSLKLISKCQTSRFWRC